MNVLVGVNGSETSFRALEQAVERARAAGDRLTVAILDGSATDAAPEEAEARVREALAAAGMDAEVRHLSGRVAGRLVDMADGEGFDRLVLAGNEPSPLGKVQLDHVAEFAVLNARTTVTLVR